MSEDGLQKDTELKLSEENEKEQKIQNKRESILSKISLFQLDTLTEKVAWILNNYPDSRNSDITLQVKYWEHFEDDIYSGNTVNVDDLFKLTRLTSISRSRATIQNTYKLFLAEELIRAHRGTLEIEKKEEVINESFFPHSYTVYADESGKTNEFLIVGSAWMLNPRKVFGLIKNILELKSDEKFDKEFHFKEIKKDNLTLYYKLADLIGKKSAFLSFKALSVEKRGISNVQAVFKDLFYQLLIKGINHENDTGRAPLPRMINFVKDQEEPGTDRILMADIEDKLKNAAKNQLDDKLQTGRFEALDSKGNYMIQIADMFTSSINRVLNTWVDGTKPKDKFAEYFLEKVGVNIKKPGLESYGDKAVSIYL